MSLGLGDTLRSLLGSWINLGEDPEILLTHLHDDLRTLTPLVDGQLAWVSASLRLLERELEVQDAREVTLADQLEAALKDDRKELALALAAALEALSLARRSNQAQLRVLREAHRHGLDTKRQVLARVQDRCREVAAYLPTTEEATWRARIAEAVAGLARASLPPDLEARIAAIEAEAARQEDARDLPGRGETPVDLDAEAARLEGLAVLQQARAR